MLQKKIYMILFVFFSLSQFVASQEYNKTFIATKGDGIISVLRREGLDVNTYYQEFLDLNEGLISNGSLLKFGVQYKIPNGNNSFSNMGRKISLNDNAEFPIFDTKIATLRKKDTLLRNTVYYLLFDKFDAENLHQLKNTSKTRNEIALAMAEALLEQGARVFLFEDSAESTAKLGDYVAAINMRYLKYQNKYQRLLVFDVDGDNYSETAMVSIEHNQKSKEGKRFANSIEQIFKTQKMKINDRNKKDASFIDKTNMYLANNALPAMTFIKIEGQNKKATNTELASQNKAKFVDLITTGIQTDYSNIILEDKE